MKTCIICQNQFDPFESISNVCSEACWDKKRKRKSERAEQNRKAQEAILGRLKAIQQSTQAG